MSPPGLPFLLVLAQLLQAEILGQADAQRIGKRAPDTAQWWLEGCKTDRANGWNLEGCTCNPGGHLCQPLRISARANERVTLPCTFAYPFRPRDADNIRVSWRSQRFHGTFVFNHSENYTHPNISGRVSLVGDPKKGDASVQIDDLKETDSNTYFCRVSVQPAEGSSGREEWQSIDGTNLTVLPGADKNLLGVLLGISALLAALVILGLVVFLARRKGCGPQCPGTRGAAGRGKAEEAAAGREAGSKEEQDPAQCCLVLFLLLLLGEGWSLAALYCTWLYLDWETPVRGGRRFAWVCSWRVWHYFRDYFPITLVKTAELDPSRNYLFGFHPHGVLVAGAFGNFCTDATGFQELFPGLTPHLLMLPFWFKVPFFRDYIMSGGLVSSEKASAAYLLDHEGGGQVAVVAVGGAPESLDARPGATTLQVRGRKGFIKMALRHGAALVPVFSFGENELFNQVSNPQGSFVRSVQERLQKVMGVALPLFHARGVFQYSFGLLPFRRPIHTVVGAPIPVPKTPHPSREAIDELHSAYLERLVQLFEDHKGKYGVPEDKHLTLI